MQPHFLQEDHLALATDLYQLTMGSAYHTYGKTSEATFEYFVRSLPDNRGYLIFAGLEQLLYYLKNLTFGEDDLDYLRNHSAFRNVPESFFSFLRSFRFSGSVDALAEGTPFFAMEPVVRITAPIIEAQLIETYLLSTLNFETLIATKASRIVDAAKGRPVYDFGFRRAHGPGAAMLATRAAMIGGCMGTSNVLAAKELGVPAVGTMAHSWVMANDTEKEAFESFAKLFPNSTLLIDTFDTAEGARLASKIPGIRAVRIDSGDLAAESAKVRRILDTGGRLDCKIIASGDLNEYKVPLLLTAGAPIDAFGIGTELVTSRDAPALGGVYKLVEQVVGDQRVGRMKSSPGKVTYPGQKQVYRKEAKNTFIGDIVAAVEEPSSGSALLERVMVKGEPIISFPPVERIRERTRENVAKLPAGVRKGSEPEEYSVLFSRKLEEERRSLEAHLRKGNKETS